MPDVVSQFAELFQGRTDAYGTEQGGCWRVDPVMTSWPTIVMSHLNGDCAYGVYPASPGGMCRWGCVDFDVKTKGKPAWDYETEEDAHVAALNLYNVLKALGITGWIERTRSYGRHVWVFAEGWVPANEMRACLLFACSVAGVSQREVNPKHRGSNDWYATNLGNYVRLPYPGALADTFTPKSVYERCFLIDKGDGGYIATVDHFVELALATRVPADVIEKWAAHWQEPTPEPIKYSAPETGGDLVSRLNGLAYTMWRDGPIDEKPDRSLFYKRFCHKCRESGLDMGETLYLLEQVDSRVGKYVNRSDRAQRLQETVRAAYR